MSQIARSHGHEIDAIKRSGVGIPLARTHHRGKSRVDQLTLTVLKILTSLDLNSLFLPYMQKDVICNAGNKVADCQPKQVNLERTEQQTKHLYKEK